MKVGTLVVSVLALVGFLATAPVWGEEECVHEFGMSPCEGDTPGYARDDGKPQNDPADSHREGRGSGEQVGDPADGD